MDTLITAAARALAAGDPIGALKRVALRDDAPALALRGIAMAQLGDLVRAKALLRQSDLPITEIAHRIGCSSHSHFSVLFHRVTGLTPRQFRALG